jgi:hypothetical protein
MRTYLLATVAAALLAAGPAFAGEPGAPAPAVAKDAAKKPSPGKTQLRLKVDPPSRVFVDGVDRGQKGELVLPVKPGGHVVRFVHANGDEHETRIVCQAGKTTAYEWKFDNDSSGPAAADIGDFVVP